MEFLLRHDYFKIVKNYNYGIKERSVSMNSSGKKGSVVYSQQFRDNSWTLSLLTNDLKSFFENDQRVSALINIDGCSYPISSFKHFAMTTNCTIMIKDGYIDIVQSGRIVGVFLKRTNKVLYRLNMKRIISLDFLIGKSSDSIEEPGIGFYLNICMVDGKIYRFFILGLNAAILLYTSNYLKKTKINVNDALIPFLSKEHMDSINAEVYQVIEDIPAMTKISKV